MLKNILILAVLFFVGLIVIKISFAMLGFAFSLAMVALKLAVVIGLGYGAFYLVKTKLIEKK